MHQRLAQGKRASTKGSLPGQSQELEGSISPQKLEEGFAVRMASGMGMNQRKLSKTTGATEVSLIHLRLQNSCLFAKAFSVLTHHDASG